MSLIIIMTATVIATTRRGDTEMASKKLIDKVARDIAIGIYEDAPSIVIAEKLISTILAAIQEPTEGMTANGYIHCYNPSRTWKAMLNASALGEQS